MTKETKHPVVMRMQGMFPNDLGGYEKHRTREGGDLGHVDRERSSRNQLLVGGDDWARQVREEIEEMTAHNYALELERLRKRRRKAEAKKRIVEGPRDPWRNTRHGPMREITLTANKEWFADFDFESYDDVFGENREARFEALAVSLLKEHFGDDLVHARADRDEQAYHIHAVVLPRSETKDRRRMLQPSKHEMIRNYEAAQDSVGEWFEELGLKRGEQRAKAIREAREHNRKLREGEEPINVPEHREHVSPADWRKEQERKLAEKDKAVAKKEKTADAVLSIAEAVAKGDTRFLDEKADENQPPKVKHARGLFGSALSVLQRKAREEAQDEVRGALEQIRKADAVIVKMAGSLPEQARKALSAARPSLAAQLSKLHGQVQKWAKPSRDRGPEK
ncbi:plasmid recombination protein [Actibacterium pelagium]|uniref:Plasmid recombination enzyme n=1 Tax=Actibacterium pelagium TaxID=2029103 RepID=A0A917ANX6_9RHOB|nr:plasmid recombination protein [Actibacterium pelagium]GGE62913.1 hypothetical protein GCM10011517_33300 [Actibacterium pelagium]